MSLKFGKQIEMFPTDVAIERKDDALGYVAAAQSEIEQLLYSLQLARTERDSPFIQVLIDEDSAEALRTALTFIYGCLGNAREHLTPKK